MTYTGIRRGMRARREREGARGGGAPFLSIYLGDISVVHLPLLIVFDKINDSF